MLPFKSWVLFGIFFLSLASNAFVSNEKILKDAKNLKPLVTSIIAHNFLDATADLPDIQTRQIKNKKGFLSVGEDVYYGAKRGGPLSYVRALDIMGKAGLCDVSNKRLFDFGYGNIGHLRLIASLGADVVGVDVDLFLKELYSDPTDTGPIKRALAASDGPEGSLTLLSGQFPKDSNIRDSVGQAYDVIMSKNVLKRGYIHPEEEVDPSMLVHLDMSDEEFVQIIYDALNKDGYFMMYNLCPPPNQVGQPYIPWADGRCPFDQELLERVGFLVLEYNRDDREEAHKMARALGWDDSMDLEKELFSQYTLVMKI